MVGDLLVTVGLTIRDGTNTPRVISKLMIRDGTNTPREISAIYARDENNIPRLIYNPSGSLTLSVALSDDEVQGTSSGTGTATTAPAVTATPSGGTAPYTYAWTLDSYSASVPPTANSLTSATTTFTQTSMDPGGIYTSAFRITVTDANSVTAFNIVSANFADFSPV